MSDGRHGKASGTAWGFRRRKPRRGWLRCSNGKASGTAWGFRQHELRLGGTLQDAWESQRNGLGGSDYRRARAPRAHPGHGKASGTAWGVPTYQFPWNHPSAPRWESQRNGLGVPTTSWSALFARGRDGKASGTAWGFRQAFPAPLDLGAAHGKASGTAWGFRPGVGWRSRGRLHMGKPAERFGIPTSTACCWPLGSRHGKASGTA
jgi:hypothetical protein